jgi:serine/threonine-protein kinase
VDLFRAADRDLVLEAVSAAEGMGELQACDDVAALTATPLPDDPTLVAEIEDAQQRLARVRALDQAGRLPQQRQLLADLAAEVPALGYPPLTAEVMFLHANLLGAIGEREAAVDTIEHAVAAALQAGDATIVGRTFVLRCRAFAIGHDDHVAQGCLRMARGAVERAGLGGLLEAQWLQTSAMVAFKRGEIDEAIAASTEAIELSAQVHGDSTAHAAALFDHGEIHRASERLDEARRTFERALQLQIDALGPDHPDVARTLNSLAVTDLQSHRPADAIPHLQRALEIRRQVYGPDHDLVAGTYNNLGLGQRLSGDCVSAAESFEKGLAIRGPALGPDHPQVRSMTLQRGLCELALGETDAAIASITPALDDPEGEGCTSLRELDADVEVPPALRERCPPPPPVPTP